MMYSYIVLGSCQAIYLLNLSLILKIIPSMKTKLAHLGPLLTCSPPPMTGPEWMASKMTSIAADKSHGLRSGLGDA